MLASHEYIFASGTGVEPVLQVSKTRVLPLDDPEMASKAGFEPTLFGSEPNVLPLDDLEIMRVDNTYDGTRCTA